MEVINLGFLQPELLSEVLKLLIN